MSKKKVDKNAELHDKDKAPVEASETAQDTTLENDSQGEQCSIDPTIQLQNDLDQMNDKYLRLNAEFQNYRKRVEKEKSDIFKFGNEKIFIEMLPIMDNFERAIAASEKDSADNKIIDGIKMIKKSFDELFEKNEVKKIEALNQSFDPIKHHAVMTVEAEDGEQDKVIEVFQDGYIMHDKVIRPCMVKVSN